MATKIIFLYNNLLTSATLTASSAATGFPAANLQNPFRTKVWRTAGGTPGTANLVIYHGTAAKAVTCIALTGYNWAAAPGTLDIEFNATDSWGSPSAHEHLTWTATPTAIGNKATIIKTFASQSYKYNRLNVVSAPGDWDLGVIFVGTYFQPAINLSRGFALEIVDPSMENSTIGGQSHFDSVEKYRRLSFDQRVSSETEFKYFQTLFNTVGTTKPLIISYDYDNYTDTTIYGYFTRTMAGKHKDQNIYDISFDFKEAR